MPLTTPPLITVPFASAGDKTVVPVTDSSGFVSYTSGYTPDYELNLTSGDPQAKAVERGIQNYLFGSLTTGLQAWQQAARPPWYSNMPGGYSKWAEVVIDTGDGFPKPYRSLVANNVANPVNSANWEYIEGTAELVKHVPMPSGGPAGSGAFIITVATNFNTLSANGTYQFLNDAVVTGSPNAPNNGGNKAQAGLLESTTWVDGPNTYSTQFYRDKAGIGYMRGAVNGTWTNWRIWAMSQQYIPGEIRMWNGAANEAAVVAAWGPGWHFCNGQNNTPNLMDRFIIAAGSSYAAGAVGGAGSVVLAVGHLPPHNHVINIADPGHAHGVYDPGHGHGVSDPGHNHGISDPGHSHQNGGPQNIWWLRNENNWALFYIRQQNQGEDWTRGSGTGIGIYGNTTGISIAASGTGIGIYGAGTGISASSNNTGSGAAFSIIPYYYALAYVIYTGA